MSMSFTTSQGAYAVIYMVGLLETLHDANLGTLVSSCLDNGTNAFRSSLPFRFDRLAVID